MRLLLAFALGVAMSATAVQAADPASEGNAKPKKERKICKDIPRSGSNLPLRKCLSAAQWLEFTQNGGDLDTLMAQHRETGAVSGTLSPGAIQPR